MCRSLRPSLLFSTGLQYSARELHGSRLPNHRKVDTARSLRYGRTPFCVPAPCICNRISHSCASEHGSLSECFECPESVEAPSRSLLTYLWLCACTRRGHLATTVVLNGLGWPSVGLIGSSTVQCSRLMGREWFSRFPKSCRRFDTSHVRRREISWTLWPERRAMPRDGVFWGGGVPKAGLTFNATTV